MITVMTGIKTIVIKKRSILLTHLNSPSDLLRLARWYRVRSRSGSRSRAQKWVTGTVNMCWLKASKGHNTWMVRVAEHHHTPSKLFLTKRRHRCLPFLASKFSVVGKESRLWELPQIHWNWTEAIRCATAIRNFWPRITDKPWLRRMRPRQVSCMRQAKLLSKRLLLKRQTHRLSQVAVVKQLCDRNVTTKSSVLRLTN